MSTDKPWENEPDHHLFESHGYVCEVRRHEWLGTLNGYIYVPLTHPIVGSEDDVYELKAHGGITFFDREGDTFSIGFDCAHFGDYYPAKPDMGGVEDSYKDIAFVINELENLAQQLKEKENAN